MFKRLGATLDKTIRLIGLLVILGLLFLVFAPTK